MNYSSDLNTFLFLLPLLVQIWSGIHWFKVLPTSGKLLNLISFFTSIICIYFILVSSFNSGLDGLFFFITTHSGISL